MKIQNVKNNGKVSYTKLVDLLSNQIMYAEARNATINKILNMLYEELVDKLSVSKDWKEVHISAKTISLLERYNLESKSDKDVYLLAKKFIEYNNETSDFRKVQDIFTLLEYWKNPIEMQNLSPDWKDIMSRKK